MRKRGERLLSPFHPFTLSPFDLPFHCLNDRPGGDAEMINQLLGRAASRDFAHGQALDAKSLIPHGLADRVAEAALRVMIFDREEPPGGRAAGGDERIAIDRLD